MAVGGGRWMWWEMILVLGRCGCRWLENPITDRTNPATGPKTVEYVFLCK